MKKLKKIMAGIMAAATIFTCAPLTANAAIEIPLEKTDVEGYDFYSCSTHYYTDENGENVTVYHDYYYDFTSDFGGTYHEFYRNYKYVFVTLSDETASEKIDEILGEQTETVFYYGVADNQIVYDYSSEADYEALYDIKGVEKVELAKHYFSGDFSAKAYSDHRLEEYGIVPYDNNLLMSTVKTDDSFEPTIETFAGTGYDVKAVLEGYSDDWYIYYEYEGLDSYVEFDEQARNIDGILSSNVLFLHCESVTESANLSFDIVENETEFGDVNYDNVIDLYDAIEISKYIMGISELDEDTILLADINRDGETNLYDAVEIAKTLIL